MDFRGCPQVPGKAECDNSDIAEEDFENIECEYVEDYHNYLKSASSIGRDSFESADDYHAHLKDIESPIDFPKSREIQWDGIEVHTNEANPPSIKRRGRSSDEYHNFLKIAKAAVLRQTERSSEKSDHLLDYGQTNASQAHDPEKSLDPELHGYHSCQSAVEHPSTNESVNLRVEDSASSRDDHSLFCEIVQIVQERKGVQENAACGLLEKWSRDYHLARLPASSPIDGCLDPKLSELTGEFPTAEAHHADVDGGEGREPSLGGHEQGAKAPGRIDAASDSAIDVLGTVGETVLAQASSQGSSQGAFAIGAACVAALAAISVAVTRLVLVELPLRDLESQKANDASLEVRTNVERLRFEMKDVERKMREAQKEIETDHKALENDRKLLKERTRLLEHQEKMFKRYIIYWNSSQVLPWRGQDTRESSSVVETIEMALKNLPEQLSRQRMACSPNHLPAHLSELTSEHWAEKIRGNVLNRNDIGEQVIALCEEINEIFVEASEKWNLWVRYTETLKSRSASVSSA